MSDPIQFSDIELRAREDCRIVNANDPDTLKISGYIRDAYRDIMDKRPDARIKDDGSMMPGHLTADTTTLYGELNDFMSSFVYYVKWRIHSRSKMEANQAHAAASDWRDYMQSLGFNTPEPQDGG